MKKIITAIGNPKLNNQLRKYQNIQIIGKDIQYQEGIIEILENKKEINILILSETIPGEMDIITLIKKIKLINNKIKIIIILENEENEMEEKLIENNINNIFYNNKTKINEILNCINDNKIDKEIELKNEIKKLKEVISENQQKEKTKNIFKKIIEKIPEEKTKVITILGSGGVGKSVVSINIANAFKKIKNKILILDFDIINNSIHTILGVKKYPKKIKDKKEIQINDLIIKVNKKIDLISGVDLLFNFEQKINIKKLEKIIDNLKGEYDVIIIDTSSECFFNYNRALINNSDLSLFLIEPNLIEIKKSKNLLDIYIKEWKIKKEKIKILLNKTNENSTDEKIIKNIFEGIKVIGQVKLNIKYNLMINKNIKNNFIDKNIEQEYEKIIKKLLK